MNIIQNIFNSNFEGFIFLYGPKEFDKIKYIQDYIDILVNNKSINKEDIFYIHNDEDAHQFLSDISLKSYKELPKLAIVYGMNYSKCKEVSEKADIFNIKYKMICLYDTYDFIKTGIYIDYYFNQLKPININSDNNDIESNAFLGINMDSINYICKVNYEHYHFILNNYKAINMTIDAFLSYTFPMYYVDYSIWLKSLIMLLYRVIMIKSNIYKNAFINKNEETFFLFIHEKYSSYDIIILIKKHMKYIDSDERCIFNDEDIFKSILSSLKS